MKFVHKSKQAQALLLQQLLYLRYQTTQPNKTNRPKPVLPLSTISAMLKVPVNTLTWMHRRYFNQKETRLVKAKQTPTMNVSPQGLTPVNIANLKYDELVFITSQSNQNNWATLSISQRCVIFHRQFPDRRISKGVMLRIMKLVGLRRKKIEISNIPTRLEERYEEFDNSTVALDNKLSQVLEEKGHLVFLDECVFKSRDFKKVAWSQPYQNLQVFDRTPKQPCQCICSAICSCHGILTHHQVDYSFNHESFMEMLRNISGAVKDEKIYLFMDGASFHRNPEVKKLMVELNIEPIYNVGYSFQYNPCERLWAQYKMLYRKLLLEKMLRDPGPKGKPLKEALFETLCQKEEDVKKSIPKFVKKALGMLRRDANMVRKQKGEEELKDIV